MAAVVTAPTIHQQVSRQAQEQPILEAVAAVVETQQLLEPLAVLVWSSFPSRLLNIPVRLLEAQL